MAGEGGGSRKARLAPTLHEPKGRARRARGTVIRHVFGAPFRLAAGSAQSGPRPLPSHLAREDEEMPPRPARARAEGESGGRRAGGGKGGRRPGVFFSLAEASLTDASLAFMVVVLRRVGDRGMKGDDGR